MDAYLRILDKLSRFFDTERGGALPFNREDYNLEPLRNYLRSVGAVRPAPRVIHVGGTKGKGSVTTLSAALLQAHEWTVGSYFSPHLVSFRERIRLQGRPIDGGRFAMAVERVLAEKPDPGGAAIRSVFEALTAAAAMLFQQAGLNAAVMEVGLGGRLDATNALETDVSVLTPISLDHTEVLGETIPAIAKDKAEILRPGHPAIFGPQAPEGLEVLVDKARSCGAEPQIYGRDFWVECGVDDFAVAFSGGFRIEGLKSAMQGSFQRENTAIAFAAARAILGTLDPAVCRQVVATTRIAGRLQHVTLPDGGQVVLDGAHNPFAAETVAREAEQLHGKPQAVLVGISSNKDGEGILRALLPLADPLICASFGGPRALAAGKIGEMARRLGGQHVLEFPDVESAWAHWLGIRKQRPTLLATGSLFLVGKLLRVLHAEGRVELDPPPDPEF